VGDVRGGGILRATTHHPEERPVAVHLTPDDIAALLEVEPDAIVSAAEEVAVPVYQGQIDRVLFAEALQAAGHPLGEVAAERLLRAGDASSG
jgi:hypothetical protein